MVNCVVSDSTKFDRNQLPIVRKGKGKRNLHLKTQLLLLRVSHELRFPSVRKEGGRWKLNIISLSSQTDSQIT